MADPATDNQTQDDRPEWLPENFKSPEDMAASYKEAQRKISEQGQNLKDLQETVDSLTELAATLQQTQQTYQPPDPNDHPLVAQYEQAMETGDYRQALAVHAQIATLAAQQAAQQAIQQQQPQMEAWRQSQTQIVASQAENHLRATYQDWDQYQEKVADVIEQNPVFANALKSANTPTEFASVLDQAYRSAKFEDFASAQTQQAQNEAAKLAAQTATGNGPARIMAPAEAQAEWDRIRAAGATSPWTT